MTEPRSPGAMLTPELLVRVMPRIRESEPRLNPVMDTLVGAAYEADLATPRRLAAFLATLAHESGELRWMEELPHRKAMAGCRACERLDVKLSPARLAGALHEAGEQYEGRKDLGNTEPGDGVRYKGRGPLQLTGRANYRAAGKALGLPLEEQPELAARLDVGLRVAAWFWRTKKLNEPADAGDFREVTRRVNGGYNGLEDRLRYYERALRALGAE